MGFETQEEAERWAEEMEFRAEQIKEEVLLASADPKEAAWRTICELPAYKDISPLARELQRAVFEYAWNAALRSKA